MQKLFMELLHLPARRAKNLNTIILLYTKELFSKDAQCDVSANEDYCRLAKFKELSSPPHKASYLLS